MTDTPPSEMDIAAVLARLTGGDRNVRSETLRQLVALTPEEKADLLRHAQNHRPAPSLGVQRWLLRLPGLLPVRLPRPQDVLLCAFVEQDDDPRWLVPSLTLLWQYVIYAQYLKRRPRVYVPVIPLLVGLRLLLRSRFTDYKVFNALYSPTRKVLLTGITRYLIDSTIETLPSLSLEARRGLLTLLWKPYADMEMSLRVLRLVSKIGGEEAIPTLDWLLKQDIGTENGWRLRSATQECLDDVRARIADKKQSASLLRPSDALPSPESELLLPTGASTLSLEELLRALGEPS